MIYDDDEIESVVESFHCLYIWNVDGLADKQGTGSVCGEHDGEHEGLC